MSAAEHLHSNGTHHATTVSSKRRNLFWRICTILAVIAAIVAVPLKNAKRRRRLYNAVRGFYMLAVMPASDWDDYYKSLDVMAKDKIENAEDERLVGMYVVCENE